MVASQHGEIDHQVRGNQLQLPLLLSSPTQAMLDEKSCLLRVSFSAFILPESKTELSAYSLEQEDCQSVLGALLMGSEVHTPGQTMGGEMIIRSTTSH